MANLKWLEALAAAPREFKWQTNANNWPDGMSPDQLSALQRPWVWGEWDARNLCMVLDRVLCDDCARGAIFCEQGKVFLPLLMTPGGAFGPPIYITQLFHWIKPAAFRKWLFDQGEAPSVHVKNWFTAMGLDANLTVVASVSPLKGRGSVASLPPIKGDEIPNAGTKIWTSEKLAELLKMHTEAAISDKNPTQLMAKEYAVSKSIIRRRLREARDIQSSPFAVAPKTSARRR